MSRLAVVSRANHERPRLHLGDAAEVGSVGVVEEGLYDARSARLGEDERGVGGAVHPHDARLGDATVLDVVTIAHACRGIERAHHDQRPDGALYRLAHGGGRRAELLKETVPRLSRVAVLRNPKNISSAASWKESQLAALGLKMQVQSLAVRSPGDFHNLSDTLVKERFQALNVVRDPLIRAHMTLVIEFAMDSRLPAIYEDVDFVDRRGLMWYGTSHPDLYHHAATYVDKILKGAKPADLPVEQPMKFEFVINLKAAKQIGLTIPPNVLARADRVIK